MNVIETLRKKITTCPLMKTFNAVHMDYTEPNDGQAGLFFNGASLVRRSVEGDSDWQARFTLYTFCDTFEDYQRISASNFLLGLTYYLQSLSGIEIVENVNGDDHAGEIQSVEASNGMLYQLVNANYDKGGQYQIQISVNYTIYE